MKREIVLSRRARNQLVAVFQWWSQHRDKAPGAFDEDVDRTWKLLQDNPEIGKKVGKGTRRARRILMERVRYYVYYRLPRPDTIQIIFIWHASRRPPRL